MRKKAIFTHNSLNTQTWWWCKMWLIWLRFQLTISMTSEKFLLRSVTLNGCSLGCDDEAFSMSDVFTCEKRKKTYKLKFQISLSIAQLKWFIEQLKWTIWPEVLWLTLNEIKKKVSSFLLNFHTTCETFFKVEKKARIGKFQ